MFLSTMKKINQWHLKKEKPEIIDESSLAYYWIEFIEKCYDTSFVAKHKKIEKNEYSSSVRRTKTTKLLKNILYKNTKYLSHNLLSINFNEYISIKNEMKEDISKKYGL